MSTPESHSERDGQLDRATADRLARLRTMPVDLSALRTAVDARVGRAGGRGAPAGRTILFRMPGQLRAAAASLLVAGLVIVAVLVFTGGPVVASPDRLADIHNELVAGGGHDRQAVDSIDAANARLAAQNPGAPAVPGVADDHVMSCCVHMVGRKRMSCVSLVTDGVPVSLAVAGAADVRLPASETLTADGVTYHVQSAQGVNMVMTQRNGRWVCVMGKLPTPRLMEIAKGLRF
jgi:hypothetical protein